MIRLFGILIGLGFTVVVLFALISGIGPAFSTLAKHGQFVAPTAEHDFHKDSHAPEGGFSFAGPLGKFDRQQLQRGFQVYEEVCASCHSLNFVAVRDLTQLGYSDAEVKAIAAKQLVRGVNPDTGEVGLMAGKPTDGFTKPYESNEQAAIANNNAIPPDLSLITKARKNGAEYVYSLLTGYEAAVPAKVTAEFPEFEIPETSHYNPYFHSLGIAMAPPLTMDGQVTYGEGNPPPTKAQMAADVSAFLAWTAEPTMEKRKQTGWWVVLFLIFATVLAYLSKQQIWANAKPKKSAS